LVVKDIVEVLYAPHKAFKRVIQQPKYLGPLIIVIVFVAAQTGFYYTFDSKLYPQVAVSVGPQGDSWTENATLWQSDSGVAISNNYVDFINAAPVLSQYFAGIPDYYGNSSIEFKATNLSSMQMTLRELDGDVNCGPDGFRELSMRVKIVDPADRPENVTLYLYSLNDVDFFSYDLTAAISASNDIWNNITVPVGSSAWSISGNPKWENITSVALSFAWPSMVNIDIRLDGLFFKSAFRNSIEVYGSQEVIISYALSSVTPLLFQWIALTALMYLIIKGLKGNVVWKPLMVAVGLALITFVVQALVLLVAYSTLPNLNLSLELLAGVSGEFDTATVMAIEQITIVRTIVQIAIWIWIFGLGTLIVRTITGVSPLRPAGSTQVGSEEVSSFSQFGWSKSMLVSIASLGLTIIIMGFLGIG
jgi:hypothetical protein